MKEKIIKFIDKNKKFLLAFTAMILTAIMLTVFGLSEESTMIMATMVYCYLRLHYELCDIKKRLV